MVKILDGKELAGYLKEKQARTVRRLRAQKIWPKLVIIRDNDSAVIEKYVALKQQYGEDIGITVEDWYNADIRYAIGAANRDPSIHALIVQLPLKNPELLPLVREIAPAKDVDGLANIVFLSSTKKDDGTSTHLSEHAIEVAENTGAMFESATATAINWLLSGYSIQLTNKKIAVVGYGKLVGAPLTKMWRNSGLDVTVFDRGDDLERLRDFDVVVSATGVPRLIHSAMIKSGAVVVDAGTANEDGVLVGDVDDEVRRRKDLLAITPKIGGVGPMTVAVLFEHVLIAAERTKG